MEQLTPNYYFDMQKQFEDFVESVGYTLRVGSYFVIRECDGYINVRREFPSDRIYAFHKNFYLNEINPHHDNSTYEIEVELFGYNCIMTRTSIYASFNRYSDFKNFLANYHKTQGRRLKLKQINEKE